MDHQTLDKAIDSLELLLSHTGIGKSGIEYKWECVFKKCHEIQEGFNSKPHYPTKPQRESAWARFNLLRSQAYNEHREYKKGESNTICKQLLRDLMHANHNLGDIIAEATIFAFDKTDVEDMKRKGSLLRSVRQSLKDNKNVLIHEDQQLIWSRILEVQANQDAWWGKWKARYAQRQEEKQAKVKKHEEWLEKQSAWKSRVRENISKNQEKLDKAEAALAKSQAHADEIREKIESAWNDSFKERAATWLEEEEERSKSIEESIERLKKWIEEDERKLRE